MTSPAQSAVQNLLPVQAYFDAQDNFVTFIGQNKPFSATISPYQSGLIITNSTIDNTTIGATTPSTGVFTNMSTTTGQVANAPSGATDLINKAYADALQIGLSFKNPANCATTANITLSGLQTIDGFTVAVGDRVLVKDQTNPAFNGIYTVASGAWARSGDADLWQEYVSAFLFVESGSTYAGTAWYCPALPGGTLNVTPITWNTFTFAASYSAGTGLNLSGTVFSIANTAVTAGAYGSASKTLTATVNAQGQLTALSASDIAIAGSQITSGTIGSSYLSGSYTGITGVGTLTAGTWNASTIGVAYGGTGATTLSGYVKGNGTSAFTASASVPTTDLSGTITNGQLANSSITINGSSVSLGGTATVTASTTSTLTIGTGLSGTSFNGSAPVTIAIDSSVATLSGVQSFTNKTINGTTNTLTNIGNGSLTNSSITFGATAVSLGGTVSALNAVSIGGTTRASGDFTTLSANTTTNTTPVLSFNASNTIASFGSTTASSYNQLVIQNKSSSAGASTNYVLSNDLGTDSTYYGEFGMNSSTYTATTYVDFFSMNNGVYFSSHDTDVTIGSGNGYKTYFAWGTSGQSAHVINASGAIGLNTNLGTTSATTGTTNYGTSGYVLTSAGSGAPPTWSANAAIVSITDDTSTNATRYPLFAAATSGTITTEYTSSTKLQFNPSTGALTTTSLTPTNAITGTYGGTGVNNGSSTITIAGNLTHAGAFTQTFTATGNTSVTLPTTGTLATLAGTETLTNKWIQPRVLASTANSATPTLNTDSYDMMVITGQSVAITSFTTNLTGTPVNGQKLWISITGTGAIAITWGAKFESSTVTLPTTTVTTNRLDVGFVWNAATSAWRCVAVA
ncbi:hypothetical protein UFOVP96_4 [uncultured Caudovirales phage]|uniref:Uncharacterized protein n=1 Tax=uncultured Caudovirales phage TaxID=2100421 RepID=A0A6J5L2G5_9CAUD|nr:hypothetical protein UFOVP96_4 [uncultured Caudovirales phage]